MSYKRIAILLVIALLAAGGALFFFVPRADDLSSVPPAARQVAADSQTLLEQTLQRALAAYNSDDEAGFLALFSAEARPAPTRENYQALFNGLYREEFGRFKKGHILGAESAITPEDGLLVYEAEFQKHHRVRVSANFVREAGTVKLAQLRCEKM